MGEIDDASCCVDWMKGRRESSVWVPCGGVGVEREGKEVLDCVHRLGKWKYREK